MRPNAVQRLAHAMTPRELVDFARAVRIHAHALLPEMSPRYADPADRADSRSTRSVDAMRFPLPDETEKQANARRVRAFLLDVAYDLDQAATFKAIGRTAEELKP